MSSALPTGLDVMMTTVSITVSSNCPTSWKSRKRTLSFERHIHILEHRHRIRAAPFLLGVEQDVALFRDLALDHVEQDGPKGLFHVRTDPDEEPVVELEAGGEDSADAGTGADGDAAAVEMA